MLARLQYLRFCLSKMYVNVVFVIFVQRSEFNTALYKNYLLLFSEVYVNVVFVIFVQRSELNTAIYKNYL